jgi:plastocyanin
VERTLGNRSGRETAKAATVGAAGTIVAACLAGTACFGGAGIAAAATVEVRLIQTPTGEAYFDPAGVHIAPGDTVRWMQVSGFHSITAYHPRNDNHELRIPEAAKPWDSDVLLTQYPSPGSTFEHVFSVGGVYDYFCKPHEMAGMVGRVVVGDPGSGPGTKPVGYAPGRHWKPVPQVARDRLPSVADIVRRGAVPGR